VTLEVPLGDFHPHRRRARCLSWVPRRWHRQKHAPESTTSSTQSRQCQTCSISHSCPRPRPSSPSCPGRCNARATAVD
jgi:hypothetical protein